jgi:protein-S-isoprenylcysteine O-methyltransferase Ste14
MRVIGVVVRLAGVAVVLASWLWALNGQRSSAWNTALIWCAPWLTVPITLLGRKLLDRRPAARWAERVNVPVHYAMMVALGVALFPGFRLLLMEQTVAIPVLRRVLAGLVLFTGIATFLTVLNLALRGLGAPFALKLSSRLATDWMYAWTRNPMVLCTEAWFLSLALYHQSAWGVLWIAVSVTPGWIYFVKAYEERELEIRFGSPYRDYRARTPFLWPRRPRSSS